MEKLISEFKQKMYLEGKSKRTIEVYGNSVREFFKWFSDSYGDVEFKKLYRENILEYKSYLKNVKKSAHSGNNLCPKSINSKLSALICFNMERTEFILNDIFTQNAKEYQTRPVKAMKYQTGMENGWMLYMSNKPYKTADMPKSYAGIKFFNTKEEAMKYVESNEPQYINLNGKLIESEVEYDLLRPVMYRKYTEGEERLGVDMGIKGFTFVSDESEIYDFYILEENTWIILDVDGNIRVWEQDFLDCASSTFFGNPEDFVYQKVEDNYIKVAI